MELLIISWTFAYLWWWIVSLLDMSCISLKYELASSQVSNEMVSYAWVRLQRNQRMYWYSEKRFAFIKVFDHIHRQQHVDNASVTWCILHNILLKVDDTSTMIYPTIQMGWKHNLKKLLMIQLEMVCGFHQVFKNAQWARSLSRELC